MKKRIVNFCLIVIGILLLNSCENEQLVDTVSASQELPTNTSIDVDKSEIPNVVGFLQNKTKNGLEIKLSSKSNTSYTGELDLESIKAIIHEQGSETYTFNIKDQNRYQSFSNLHASIREGKLYTYILTYEFDKSFYEHFDFARYSGTITLSNLEGEILNVSRLEEGAQVDTLAKTHHDCSTVTFSAGYCARPYDSGCDGVAYQYTHCESILDSTGGLPWNNCMSCNDSNNGPGSNYNNNNGLGGSSNGGDGSLGDNQLSNAIIYDGRFIDNLSNLLGRPVGLAESGWIFSNQENYAVTQDIRSLISRNYSFQTELFDPAVIELANTILDASVSNKLTTDQAATIFRLMIENGDSDLVISDIYRTVLFRSSNVPWTNSNGQIDGKSEFTYTGFRDHIYPDGQIVREFRLANGDRLSRGDYADCFGCSTSTNRTHYRPQNSNLWFEYLKPPTDCLSCSLDHLFNTVLTQGLIAVARYAVPFEDAVILFTGQDLEGVESSRAVAGTFLLIDVVTAGAGSKLFKIVRRGDDVIDATNAVVKQVDQLYKNQKEIIEKVKEGVISLTNSNRKGNFGEMITDSDFYQKGYDVLHTRLQNIDECPGCNGIDHVFKNPQTGEFIIAESKFGSSTLSTLADGTRQMSDSWIEERLFAAVNQNGALFNEIISNGYQRVLSTIQSNGSIGYKLLDENGYVILGEVFTP